MQCIHLGLPTNRQHTPKVSEKAPTAAAFLFSMFIEAMSVAVSWGVQHSGGEASGSNSLDKKESPRCSTNQILGQKKDNSKTKTESAFNGSCLTTFFSVGAAALGFTGVGSGGGGMAT